MDNEAPCPDSRETILDDASEPATVAEPAASADPPAHRWRGLASLRPGIPSRRSRRRSR
jgi:hypothetical protein